LLAGGSDRVDQFLDRDAGKYRLIHQNRGKCVTILCKELLQKSGATSRRGNDEDGLLDLLLTKAGIKKVIQGATDRNDDPEGDKQEKKERYDDPAACLKWASQVRQIKSFGGQA